MKKLTFNELKNAVEKHVDAKIISIKQCEADSSMLEVVTQGFPLGIFQQSAGVTGVAAQFTVVK